MASQLPQPRRCPIGTTHEHSQTNRETTAGAAPPSGSTNGVDRSGVVVEGTAEQRERNQAALEMLRRWQEEDAARTPEEIRELDEQWERFKKSVNDDRRGYREVIVD